MPKTKIKLEKDKRVGVKKEYSSEEKDEEKVLNPDLLLDDDTVALPDTEEIEEEEADDEEALDVDEIDPFKDKWEE